MSFKVMNCCRSPLILSGSERNVRDPCFSFWIRCRDVPTTPEEKCIRIWILVIHVGWRLVISFLPPAAGPRGERDNLLEPLQPGIAKSPQRSRSVLKVEVKHKVVSKLMTIAVALSGDRVNESSCTIPCSHWSSILVRWSPERSAERWASSRRVCRAEVRRREALARTGRSRRPSVEARKPCSLPCGLAT